MKAVFDSVQDLAKFYNARAGVAWTSDTYEWLGSICVDFKLDILTTEEVKERIKELEEQNQRLVEEIKQVYRSY